MARMVIRKSYLQPSQVNVCHGPHVNPACDIANLHTVIRSPFMHGVSLERLIQKKSISTLYFEFKSGVLNRYNTLL